MYISMQCFEHGWVLVLEKAMVIIRSHVAQNGESDIKTPSSCCGNYQQAILQSAPVITDLENKVSVIAKRLKSKFVRYSGVKSAGERLGKRPVQQGFRYI